MPQPILCRLALTLLGLLAAESAFAVDPLWLSDRRPAQQASGRGGHAAHDHSAHTPTTYGASEEEEKPRGARKQLWLRRGADPDAAPHLGVAATAPILQIIGANGQQSEVTAGERNGFFHVAVDLPEMGFYNAYLVQERVEKESRRVEVAQAELLNGTCCMKDVDPQQTRAIRNNALPLELVRDHHPGEALMTRITSGDRVDFTVLRHGQPLPGAVVTMTTQQDWSKRLVSDANGRVSFTVIRDYFPPWHQFKRRERQGFLITAELQTSESGRLGSDAYAGTVYTATLAGHYRPSATDYRSYAWGLGIVLFVVTFGGTAIYLYRRRRARPFQEVRFHEKP